jgi:pentalenic acid synthase
MDAHDQLEAYNEKLIEGTRAELEIALRTLFDRLPRLRLAVPVHAIAWKPGDTIQEMLELPVTW